MAPLHRFLFTVVTSLCFASICGGSTDYTFNVDAGVGRRFDGIGAISGGGVRVQLLNKIVTNRPYNAHVFKWGGGGGAVVTWSDRLEAGVDAGQWTRTRPGPGPG